MLLIPENPDKAATGAKKMHLPGDALHINSMTNHLSQSLFLYLVHRNRAMAFIVDAFTIPDQEYLGAFV